MYSSITILSQTNVLSNKIWKFVFNICFDLLQDLGGDAAAFVAPKNDLQGVKVYNAVDLEGLYTLGTVVVDYRGYRVTAQSIIPGKYIVEMKPNFDKYQWRLINVLDCSV